MSIAAATPSAAGTSTDTESASTIGGCAAVRMLAHTPAKAEQRGQCIPENERRKSNSPATSTALNSGAETCCTEGVVEKRSLCEHRLSARFRASQSVT